MLWHREPRDSVVIDHMFHSNRNVLWWLIWLIGIIMGLIGIIIGLIEIIMGLIEQNMDFDLKS